MDMEGNALGPEIPRLVPVGPAGQSPRLLHDTGESRGYRQADGRDRLVH